MRKTILIGGKAGQGPNILAILLSESLVKKGLNVFCSREYESLIRGGHNYNLLTISDEQVLSNDSKIDILVALDENTVSLHKKELAKKSITIADKKETENMYFAGRLFKCLGLPLEILQDELKKLKNFDNNLKNATRGYKVEKSRSSLPETRPKQASFTNGNQGIADGAIKSGIDIYYAYPMTPATAVMSELAAKEKEKNILVMELENEIAVIVAAVGSAITGAKSMIGTSGGGFDLMTEALSLAGQAEVPVVCYLSQRPGPSTGLATETGQGDVQMARYAGHGEFFRLVVAPGDPLEAQELTSQSFYFTQKYKIPAIILSDKHLSESLYTSGQEPIITPSKKSTELIRYNSYEHNDSGEATESIEQIKKNIESRLKKIEQITKESENFPMYKIYGNKNSKNIILSHGSTKGSILDAIRGLDMKFIQVLYIEPFPKKITDELRNAKKIILVENNATGMLADILAEKTGIMIEQKNKILRYDGRPFYSDELNLEIQKKIK